jgi:hypothetical protein
MRCARLLIAAAPRSSSRGWRIPRQRLAELESLRVQVRRFHPELAEVLGIDSSMEEKLLQLLTEQRLAEEVRLTRQHIA